MSALGSSLFFLSAALIVGLQKRKPSKKTSNKKVKISQLHIYPIKSCGGIEVQSSLVTRRGLRYDRSFMVVDETGNFITQRKKPSMALIETRIDESRNVLCISAPNMPGLEVSLLENSSDLLTTVTVWGDKCEGRIVTTNDWFATYLQLPGLQLVRICDNFTRPTDPEYAPKGQTSFSDGYPFLLASEESIRELSRRANCDVSMKRFRPNIIVDGCDAFAEDQWKNLEFQSLPVMKAKIVKPCSRCSIPDVDPITAVYDKEMKVSRVMQSFRTGNDLKLANEKWKKQLFFGQNVDHESQENFVLSVGDELIYS